MYLVEQVQTFCPTAKTAYLMETSFIVGSAEGKGKILLMACSFLTLFS